MLRFTTLFLAAGLFSTLAAAQQDTTMHWSNTPKQWNETGGVLTETVDPGTDYWRITHYGFIRDNGPFRYRLQSGNFEAKVHITGQYRELYHQAGLMVRIDEKNWIKTGVEFVDGKQNLSAVVTREVSDWSVVPRDDSPASLWMRLQRFGDAVHISWSPDGQHWTMLRVAYFPPNVQAQIGMVAAAPGKQSFPVRFDSFRVEPLTTEPKA